MADRLRLAAWNVAWMTNLFDAEGGPLGGAEPAAVRGVSRHAQLAAILAVLPRLGADLLLIVEAPDDTPLGRTHAALDGLAEAAGLGAHRPLVGFSNDTGQELALLYDPARLRVRHAPTETADAPRFDAEFAIDLDIDDRRDTVRFSKPPLEALVEPVGPGDPFRLIGVHLKSKAPHGAKSKEDALRRAIANRRKQLAQAIWLRRRVEAHLHAGEDLVVLGDLNDGPGLDAFETLFGRSSLEIVMGDEGAPGLRLTDPHAARALSSRLPAQVSTARFYLEAEGRWLSALLDYILVSSGLAARGPRWRIWHPFDDPAIYAEPALRDALLAASDHYPVTLDLPISAGSPPPPGL